MPRTAAGLLLFRRRPGGLEVLLAHPGGPFFVRKDLGAWTIPKGEVDPGEDLLDTARREFHEEIGADPPGDPFPLGQITQKGGKVVHAWALEGDFDPAALRSNVFSMEWPPQSGLMREFPEVDRAEWFDLTEARRRIKDRQGPLLDALEAACGP